MENSTDEDNIKYDAAFKRLKEILEGIQSGEVSIDDIEARIQEAHHLATICRSRLTEIEEKLENFED